MKKCISSFNVIASIKRIGFIFLFLLISYTLLANEKHPILIISSYNPDTRNTTQNITTFIEAYQKLGGKLPIVIENMNCKSLPEVHLWKERMQNILGKYTGERKPSIVMVLGQEAWASYLSFNDKNFANIPLVCGMVSYNTLHLPDSIPETKSWEPKSILINEIEHNQPIRGYFYQYDIDNNIQLIKKALSCH